VAGYYIDEHFHTGSFWSLVGLLGGVFLGFYRLIAEVVASVGIFDRMTWAMIGGIQRLFALSQRN
jgi:hypothetical protein